MTYRITLWNAEKRSLAKSIIDKAPVGARIEISEAKRSTDQNSRLWAMLAEVATQAKWHGQKFPPETWKLIFLSGLRKELRVIQNFDGDGIIQVGVSSSKLSKQEFSDLLELIACWGAQNGVEFNDAEQAA